MSFYQKDKACAPKDTGLQTVDKVALDVNRSEPFFTFYIFLLFISVFVIISS